MAGARWQEPLVVAAATAVVLIACLAPLAALVLDAFDTTTGVSLTDFAHLFASTAATAGSVTAVAFAFGLPLGVVLARTDVPGRRAALALHGFPLFIPPLLLTMGWSHLAGGSEVLFGRAGLIGVLGLALAPAVTALTVLGLDGIDPGLEDSARVVASPGAVVRRILLPLARRALVVAALVVFALAFSELGAAMFLRVRTYPAAVLARLGGMAYAPGEAFMLVLPLLALALVLGAVERRCGGARTFASLGVRTDQPLWSLGRARWPVAAACWLVVAAGLAPLGALAAVALASGRFVEALAPAMPSLWNSVRTMVVTATLVTGVGLVLARAIVDGRRVASAIDAIACLAFITPAAALGAGVIAVWNRPETAFVYAGSAILVVGLVGRYAVLGVRPLAATLSRTPPHLDEAARAAGASYLRRLHRIVVPVHHRAIVGTWMLVAVFALRDLETVVLFYPPGGAPLMVRIFTLEANGAPAVVASLALVQIAVTAVTLAAAGTLLRRRR
jgi:iron(III) transport system permease protein